MDATQQRVGSRPGTTGSRPGGPRAHPRALLTLVVIATVLAVATAPPRDASGGAEPAAQTRVLAVAAPSAWRVPLSDRLDSMGVLIGRAARRVGTVSASWQAAAWWSRVADRVRGVAGRLSLDAASTARGTSAGRLSPTMSKQIASDAWAEYLALYQAGDPRADLTAPGGLVADGYGCPDGSIDQADLMYRLDELAPAMGSPATDEH